MHKHVVNMALLLLPVVFVVFVGAGLLKVPSMDTHGCAHEPCAVPEASAAFCIAHCLDAAQANHGMASSVVAVTLAVAIILTIYWPITVSRDQSFGIFQEIQDAFPPLRALRTVVLRE